MHPLAFQASQRFSDFGSMETKIKSCPLSFFSGSLKHNSIVFYSFLERFKTL